jgi:succinyl-CoA:acetate CoA-transferase
MIDPDSRIHGERSPTSAEAVARIIDRDAVLGVSGFGRVGYPKAVPEALADRDGDYTLTVVSGGGVGPEIDDVLAGAGHVARRFPYQSSATLRAAANEGRVAFHDRHIARFADEIRQERTASVDVAVVEAVAVGDDWLVPSTSIGHTASFVTAADRLVVEVNEAQPLALQRLHDVYRRGQPPNREPIPLDRPGGRIGSPRVSFDPSKLDAVVCTDRPDTPYTFRDPSERDERIADHLSAFLAREMNRNPVLSDALTIEFGVGSLGNALAGALGNVDFGDRDLRYFGEVVQDGLLDLLDDGTIAAASATSLALSTESQERFFERIDDYASDVVLRPAAVSNSPTLIDRFGVVAVNSALEVDLYGNVNSTHIGGTQLVNAIGGSGDFSRNAAVPIIALPSTASDGDISRIVPMVPHVDHTEHDVSIVVTEQGTADLRGLSPLKRARRLIDACAHPDFRTDLQAYLDRAIEAGGHVPHDLPTAFDWTDE